MRKINFKIVFVLVLSLLIMTGCGESENEKAFIEQVKNGKCISIHDSRFISINGLEKEYDYQNGNPITIPNLEIKLNVFDGRSIKEHVSIDYYKNTDVGEAYIHVGDFSLKDSRITNDTIKFCGGNLTFNIVSKEPLPTVTPEPTSTPEPLKPVITCTNPTYDGTTQKIASCENGSIVDEMQTNAGQYQVKCSNSVVTITETCEIKRVDISKATVTESGNASDLKDRLKVIYNGNTLGTSDYNINITNNSDGTESATITGIGNYTGTQKYTSNKKDISKAIITDNGVITYDKQTEEELKQKAKGAKVTLGSKELNLGSDYEIESYNFPSDMSGGVQITIKGIGEYVGTKKGIALYLFKKSCTKTASKVGISLGVNEILGADGLYHTFYSEKSKSYVVELRKNSSATIKITVPAICGKLVGPDSKEYNKQETPRFKTKEKWGDYLTVAYNYKLPDAELTVEKNDHDVSYDENGNIVYTMKLTAKSKSTAFPKDKTGKAIKNSKGDYIYEYIAFTIWRSFLVDRNDGKSPTANYSGKISVKILEDDDEEDPELVKINSKEEAECCCLKNKPLDQNGKPYDKCYYANPETKTCNDDSEPAPIEKCGGSTPKPTSKVTPKPTTKPKAKYTCAFNFNQSTKKLTISGVASNGASVRSSTIDGMTGPTITVNKATTYNGKVLFSDGGLATCKIKIDEYKCSLSYNPNTNRLTISGSSSNGAKIMKTVIDGKETTSLTPTSSRTYSGTVYFDGNKKASCSTKVEIKATTIQSGRCCCSEYKREDTTSKPYTEIANCEWTTKQCKDIGKTGVSISKSSCNSNYHTTVGKQTTK